MSDPLTALTELAWPAAFVLAWLIGEIGHRWTGLPRISLYGLVGFAVGQTQLGALSKDAAAAAMLLANVAFGLALFEFGYRINLRWVRVNPWLAATGLLESAATFVAVFATARAFGAAMLTSLLLASLAMSTSPAALIRVVNEERARAMSPSALCT